VAATRELLCRRDFRRRVLDWNGKFAMLRRLMIVLASCFLVAELAYAASWPRIQPFDQHYNFPRPQDMYLSLPVLAVTGRPAYILECASPENARARAQGFRPTREFECRLSLPGATRAPDDQLLTDGSGKAALPTAGFTWNQLNGDCYRYPDYGGQRIFRLRNMRLVITVSNVLFGSEVRSGQAGKRFIQGLTIHVEGFYDPTALNEFPVPSRYVEPKPLVPDQPAGLLDCKRPVLKSSAAGVR
jgi:hypothetical protein